MVLRLEGIIWEQLLDACQVPLHIKAILLCVGFRGPSRQTPCQSDRKIHRGVHDALSSTVVSNIAPASSFGERLDEGHRNVKFESRSPLISL